MSEYRDEAIKKLRKEDEEAKYDRHGQAMHGYIRCRLEQFCAQDDEFAQAIVQGGTFGECIAAVCEKIGTSISDLEACSRAVKFYFPDKKVLFRMEIADEAAIEERIERKERDSGIIDLSLFL